MVHFEAQKGEKSNKTASEKFKEKKAILCFFLIKNNCKSLPKQKPLM